MTLSASFGIGESFGGEDRGLMVYWQASLRWPRWPQEKQSLMTLSFTTDW